MGQQGRLQAGEKRMGASPDQNPYAPPQSHGHSPDADRDSFLPALSKGLLHRRVRLVGPLPSELDYDGKWFRQRVLIDGVSCWYVISWARIHREIRFRLPSQLDPDRRRIRIEMRFHPLSVLTITRFSVWLENELVYDEIDHASTQGSVSS
jgi:hypothetical protein